MQIASACIGDLSCTVYRVESLDPHAYADDKSSYELHFLDLPTGERETLVMGNNENAAIHLFAAWLVADSDGNLAEYCKELRDRLVNSRNKFLP